jgi:hypothetical protein
VRTFPRHFLCVLFFFTSLAPEAYCIKFYGLKIGAINNNLKSDSQTLGREPMNKLDELLAGYQPNSSAEEEVDMILKGITSEAQPGNTDTDSEEIHALAVAELGRKRTAYNSSRETLHAIIWRERHSILKKVVLLKNVLKP